MRRAAAVAVVLALAAGCTHSGSHAHPAAIPAASAKATAKATAKAQAAPSPSAPRLTSSTPQPPGKSADQIITADPTMLTLEAVLPVGNGKQRETDQTFTLTGKRRARLVDELRDLEVYTGPAPAGCQPSMRTTTIRLTSAGRQLTFVAYCVNVTTAHPTDPTLTFPPVLENDLDAALAVLTPTRSVDPPKNGSLALAIATAGTLRDKIGRKLSGRVTVSQDGVVLATRHLAAGQIWHFPVRQGSYTIATTSSGHTCMPETVTVFDHYLGGGGGSCS